MEEAREIYLDRVCRTIQDKINGYAEIKYDAKGRLFIEVGTFDKILRRAYYLKNLDDIIVRGKRAYETGTDILKDFKEKVQYYMNQKYFS